MNYLKLVVLVFALIAPSCDASAQQHKTPNALKKRTGLQCSALPLITKRMVLEHVGKKKANAALMKQVGKIFAKRIDGAETLLTEPQFRKLEKRITKLVSDTNALSSKTAKEQDAVCAEFTKLRKEMIAWQVDLEKYVKTVAKDKKLAVDKSRVIELDPEKRPRPKSLKQQQELRRSLLDFQLANYLANAMTIDVAKKKLVKRYELASRRTRELTDADLHGMYLNAFAGALDPHTTYFSPEDMEDFRISMELSLTGIGAVLTSRDGFITIEEVVPGGAADRMGKIKRKDRIIGVAQGENGESVDVIDMDVNDVVRLIRGKKGTKVKLSILRPGDNDRFNTVISRDKIDLKQQAAKLEWKTIKRGKKKMKIAIINLPSFYAGANGRDSAQDIRKLLADAKKKKADGVLLDVSKNGGGALMSAVTISGFFIERGAIVGANSRANPDPQSLDDRDPMVQWNGPLAVVTSKISASASEILAGALKDYDRAVIIGDTQTFGKGSVQQLTALPPGLGTIKVTSALFFLPGGKSTQQIGVRSDVVVPSTFSEMEIGEKYEDRSMKPASAKPFLSKAANASRTWKPVSKKEISELKVKSAKRLKKNQKFIEEMKKAKKESATDTKIKIADILKDVKSEEQREKEAEAEKDKLSVQVLEAAEVLADLASLRK